MLRLEPVSVQKQLRSSVTIGEPASPEVTSTFFSSSVYRRNSGLRLPVVYVEAASACAVGSVVSAVWEAPRVAISGSGEIFEVAGFPPTRGSPSGSRRSSPCAGPRPSACPPAFPAWCCRFARRLRKKGRAGSTPARLRQAGPVSQARSPSTGSWTSRKEPSAGRNHSVRRARPRARAAASLYPPGVSQRGQQVKRGGRPGSCLSLSDRTPKRPRPQHGPERCLASQLSLLGS